MHGEGRYAFDAVDASFDGRKLRVLSPPLGPRFIEVSIPADGFFIIQTNGRERDETPDDAVSPLTEIVKTFYPKLDDYLKSKYGEQTSSQQKDLAIYRDIVQGIESAFRENDSAWAKIVQQSGKSAEAFFNFPGIPLWGQFALFGINLIIFFASLNKDDGLGVLNVRCDSSNNFCLGTRDYKSQSNGKDDDSAGDYDLNIRVEELKTSASLSPHAGFLIQSRNGKNGNFELVVPRSEGGLEHFWRDNDAPGSPWKATGIFGQDLGRFDAVSLIQSTFSKAGNGPGNLEVVARIGDRLVAFWHPDNEDGWFPAAVPQVSVSGNPALIQSRNGKNGNFELVVPRSEGGLAHFWRDNDAPGSPWKAAGIFGQDLGRFDAVSLIQSTFSKAGNGPGNLEVVARIGNRSVAFWHPDNEAGWLPASTP